MSRTGLAIAVGALSLLVSSSPVGADTPDRDEVWQKVIADGKSLVFGRFIGKFESPEFRSRRIRLVNEDTGDETFLSVDEGLGYIEELIPPGMYSLVALEAVYYPPIRPYRPDRYRPLRQRYGLKPKKGEVQKALIYVPPDRPVYIGTIRASDEKDGIVYRGHHLRVIDEFDDAFERLTSAYPRMASTFDNDGIVPARHFMLKPSRPPRPLEAVVAMDDPIGTAQDYIAEGKYKQAVNWLAIFLPTSDAERIETKLLVGEALLGDEQYPEAIEELGEVLLTVPENPRALRLLARAHAYNGDLDDAINLYEGLAEAFPGDAEAHLQLGYIFAVRNESLRAEQAFNSAFVYDFDYLLHDLNPFLVAIKAAAESETLDYVPPTVTKFTTPPPRTMETRRQASQSGMAILIDHTGKVMAAQMGPHHGSNMPLMMMALVRASFQPASLNGVPIPSLLTVGISRPQPTQ